MKSIITFLFASVMLLTSFVPRDANDKALAYISNYQSLAISEMQRTGIPASIKLAQGLLESGWGESTLAREANNHFGIKCGSQWTGQEYYVYDDDYKDGQKIKSCFRVFDSALESYIAHSEFLSNPKKERYALLFYFPSSDYKAWAHGLKDAGYATDPKYPNKLISIIEKYELHKLDGDDNEIIAYQGDSPVSYDLDDTADNKRKNKRDIKNSEPGTPNSSHKTVMITEERGAQPSSPHHSTQRSHRGTRQKKSSKKGFGKLFDKHSRETANSLKDSDYHIVESGETMKQLAKRYGMPTALLYSKNRMPLGTQPLQGEKLQLKGTVRIGDRPQFDYPERSHSVSEFVFGK